MTWLDAPVLIAAWALSLLTLLFAYYVAPIISERCWWPMVTITTVVVICLAALPWVSGAAAGWLFGVLVVAYTLFLSEVKANVWWRDFTEGFPPFRGDDQTDDVEGIIGRAFITGWVEQPVKETP